MRSAEGQRLLQSETARQLQRVAEAIAPLPQLERLRRYNIPTTLALLGVSRKRFYEHVKAGRIRIIKDGRRSFCSGSEIARLSQLPAVPAAA
jgi:hypothetical protein